MMRIRIFKQKSFFWFGSLALSALPSIGHPEAGVTLEAQAPCHACSRSNDLLLIRAQSTGSPTAPTHDFPSSRPHRPIDAHSRRREPMLSDLLQCASSIGTGYFSPRNSYVELFVWRAQDYKTPVSNPHEPQAVTVMFGVGSSAHSRTLITVTPDQIMSTPTVLQVVPSALGDSAIRRRGSITLNLRDQIDLRTGLPVVDPQDDVSPSWAIQFEEVRSRSVYSRRLFGRSDLGPNHVEIHPSQALQGYSRDEALRIVQQELRSRLRGLPTQLESIMTFRQRSSLHSMASASGDYLSSRDLAEVRKGLCDCALSIYEPEVDQIREELTRQNSSLRVWDEGQGASRRI